MVMWTGGWGGGRRLKIFSTGGSRLEAHLLGEFTFFAGISRWAKKKRGGKKKKLAFGWPMRFLIGW